MPAYDVAIPEPANPEPANAVARASGSGRRDDASFVADAAHGCRRRPAGQPMKAFNTRPRGSVLTANRRADGAVVFLDFEGDWSDNLAAAMVARAADERRALSDRGRYEAERRQVVDPHLVEVEEIEGRLIRLGHRASGRMQVARAAADAGEVGDGMRAMAGW
jgi:Protein of unknown function (DUF2849)